MEECVLNIISQIDPSEFAARPRMHHGEPTAQFPSSVTSRARGLVALKACNWRASKKSQPTARDYVQDGILFHWDAIENVGYGQHEDRPSAWVDLAGSGLDLPLTSRTDEWSFADGEFSSQKNDTVLFKSHPQTEILDGTVSTTVEWVTRIDGDGYSLSSMDYFLALNNGGGGRNTAAGGFSNWTQGGSEYLWRVGLNSSWSGSIWIKIGDGFNSGARFHYSVTISIGADGVTCDCVQYLNGVEVKRTTGSNLSIKAPNDWYFFLGSPRGRPSVIRYYTRVLSASEVAANYAVDKARFGLT